MKNGGSDNDKGGFRTTNTCQMGWFILRMMDAKNAFLLASVLLGEEGTCMQSDFKIRLQIKSLYEF